MDQLGAQDGCLDLIKAAVRTWFFADETLSPAILPKRSGAIAHPLVTYGYETCIPNRPKVLRRVEAEYRCLTKGPDSPAHVLGTSRLRAVFDDRHAPTGAKFQDRLQVGRLTI